MAENDPIRARIRLPGKRAPLGPRLRPGGLGRRPRGRGGRAGPDLEAEGRRPTPRPRPEARPELRREAVERLDARAPQARPTYEESYAQERRDAPCHGDLGAALLRDGPGEEAASTPCHEAHAGPHEDRAHRHVRGRLTEAPRCGAPRAGEREGGTDSDGASMDAHRSRVGASPGPVNPGRMFSVARRRAMGYSDPMPVISQALPADLLERLDALAWALDTTRAEVIRRGLEVALEANLTPAQLEAYRARPTVSLLRVPGTPPPADQTARPVRGEKSRGGRRWRDSRTPLEEPRPRGAVDRGRGLSPGPVKGVG